MGSSEELPSGSHKMLTSAERASVFTWSKESRGVEYGFSMRATSSAGVEVEITPVVLAFFTVATFGGVDDAAAVAVLVATAGEVVLTDIVAAESWLRPAARG